MRIWTRRTLGVLALGGGFLGVVMILTQFLSGPSVVSVVISLPFLALYAAGIWAGVTMLEAHPDALQLNKWYWALQVPYLLSAAFSYVFYSGGSIFVGYAAISHKANFQALFGSQYRLNINAQSPTEFGINIFAAAIAFYIWRLQRRPHLSQG